MNDILSKMQKEEFYFKAPGFQLLLGDTFDVLPRIKENSVDMIFADPPYFLSNGGITCSAGKMVSVDKADWDKANGINDVHEFNKNWLEKSQRVLKPNGTIWVSGTMHNIFSVGLAMQELGYKILNTITWFKPNASPNLSCRYFTHSTELVIWAAKNKQSRHCFNYAEMKQESNGKQMRDVWPVKDFSLIWEISTTSNYEKRQGKFPTQKPLGLLRRIIRASSMEGDIVLDPFNGSGTTGIAANELKRKYIGIDNCNEYLDLTNKRYDELKNEQKKFKAL